ncbi:MAG: chorismate synthase [Schleiferiaceae bacterium]|nr:chorismate synthase [Schleiferiaceae bacterium]
MTGNTFGKAFRLTTFGESHGAAIGGIIEGCPAGIDLDLAAVQLALDRRRPGQSKLTTPRKEGDQVEFLSGIFEGTSTGTPIGFIIKNNDAKSKDYDHLKDIYRPSHADFTYEAKYGIRDYRGGGRASARETATRVAAGAIANQILKGISITAYVKSIGKIFMPDTITTFSEAAIEASLVRCPDERTSKKMERAVAKAQREGDSLGGIIQCVIEGVPAGWGEPVFDKIHADLGKAMLSINAVKGFEIGSGFAGTKLKGSQHNDAFNADFTTQTNHSGGVQGGITNGAPIYFAVAFKPTATIFKEQETATKDGKSAKLKAKGRHDPCVLPRAVPIVEAMAALVLADHFLRSITNKAI